MPRPPLLPRLRPALIGGTALALGGGFLCWRAFLADARLAPFPPETAPMPHAEALATSTTIPPGPAPIPAPPAAPTLAGLIALGEAGGHARAVALVATLPEDQRAAAFSSLFALWAERDRAAAASAALVLAEASARSVAWRAALLQWASADPAGLAAHALTLPDDAPRRAALAEALPRWLAQDPDAAVAWAGALPSSAEHDGVIALVAQDPALIREKTDLALAWAETIHEPALRSRILGRVVREWREFEPGAAERFARQSPDLSPSEREDILVGERFTAHP